MFNFVYVVQLLLLLFTRMHKEYEIKDSILATITVHILTRDRIDLVGTSISSFQSN